VGLGRFLRAFKHAFKPVHCKVAVFCRGRTRQPDDEFLADCGIEPVGEAPRVALAVRRAVAWIGVVEPLFVRASDSYPGTLELLPLWDSMDWLLLQLRIEEELGQKVRWEACECAPRDWPLTVGEMVICVRALLAQTPNAEEVAAADRQRD
jgi:hypothetical protein